MAVCLWMTLSGAATHGMKNHTALVHMYTYTVGVSATGGNRAGLCLRRMPKEMRGRYKYTLQWSIDPLQSHQRCDVPCSEAASTPSCLCSFTPDLLEVVLDHLVVGDTICTLPESDEAAMLLARSRSIYIGIASSIKYWQQLVKYIRFLREAMSV